MSKVEKIVTSTLITWHKAFGRHDLPWQVNEWYPRLVSEIMLQQTQVVTVLPKYQAFMSVFPTPTALAQASDDEVMALWAGLGYYSRARNLLKTVRIIEEVFNGVCPRTATELEKLPGLGPSTAGAIAAFAFQERAVMADGNAQRVLSRLFLIKGHAGQSSYVKKIREKALELLPTSREMPEYTQALMDFGALLCTKKPKCELCPLSSVCQALQNGCVSEYPEKKPKKERPVRYASMVFVFTGEQVWLRKKIEKGVWHGLWVPPYEERNNESEAFEVAPFLGLLPEQIKRLFKLNPLIHDFTHYRLIIQAVVVDVNVKEELARYSPIYVDKLNEVGLPTPVATLLEQGIAARKLGPVVD